MTYKAKLTYGDVYYLGNRLFTRGAEVLITDNEKEQLEEQAVDKLKVAGNKQAPIYRQKFIFQKVASNVEPDPIDKKPTIPQSKQVKKVLQADELEFSADAEEDDLKPATDTKKK